MTSQRISEDLIALAKEKPGQISFGSASIGSSGHLASEMLKTRAGIEMVHVPYKGDNPAMTDLIGGRIDMLFANMPAVIGQVQSGQLKPLAVSTAGRSDALPDVPTMQEAGIDNFEVNPWYGVLAPAGTPKEVIEQLSAELGKALQDPRVRERMASLGAQPIGTTPEEFAEIIAADTAMYAKAVEQSGATMQ